VNNVEFDHADIYKDLDAVKLAFRRLMNLVPENGRLIAGWDSQHLRDIVAAMGQKLFTQLETFGTTEDARWRVSEMDFSGELTKFTVLREGKRWGSFQSPLIGDFNLLN